MADKKHLICVPATKGVFKHSWNFLLVPLNTVSLVVKGLKGLFTVNRGVNKWGELNLTVLRNEMNSNMLKLYWSKLLFYNIYHHTYLLAI